MCEPGSSLLSVALGRRIRRCHSHRTLNLQDGLCLMIIQLSQCLFCFSLLSTLCNRF
jgi:hypothetical protein